MLQLPIRHGCDHRDASAAHAGPLPRALACEDAEVPEAAARPRCNLASKPVTELT